MTAAKQKIAQRIKALLAKSVENGATEAEAFAAMEKAREMMDKHGVSSAELEADAHTVKPEMTKRDGWGTFIIKDRIAANVAIYTDCKVWFDFGGDFNVLGSEADRQFCIWLMDSLDQFIRRSCIAFIKSQSKLPGKRWDHEKAFCVGAINRINERLVALCRERSREAKTSDGKSLMLIKSSIVDAAFAELGVKLRNATGKVTYKKNNAYTAGHAAGNNAAFSRPVNGDGAVRSIAG